MSVYEGPGADRLLCRSLPSGRKYVVKLLLKGRSVGQGPVGFILMYKNYVLQYGFRDSHQSRDLLVHVSASIAETDLLHFHLADKS
jgi:hypothetical protein